MTTFFRCTSSTQPQAREGQCWTTDSDCAKSYAKLQQSNDARLIIVETTISDLTIEECEGYDREENYTPADSPTFRESFRSHGVDILYYEDEDIHGQPHDCYRLLSERAIKRFSEISEIL